MSSYTSVNAAIAGLDKIKKTTELYEVDRGGKAGVRKKGQVGQRVKRFGAQAVKATRLAAIHIGTEILREAMQKVPVDTGELAKSGRLEIGHGVYAKGTVVGISREHGRVVSAETDIEITHKLADNNFIPDAEDLKALESRYFSVYITFHRTAGDIPNLALWLHENLNAHGGGFPAARLPGRGGKYIEEPFMNHWGKLKGRAEENLSRLMSKGVL